MSRLNCRRQGCETITAGVGKSRDSPWLAMRKRGAEKAHELPATDLMLAGSPGA